MNAGGETEAFVSHRSSPGSANENCKPPLPPLSAFLKLSSRDCAQPGTLALQTKPGGNNHCTLVWFDFICDSWSVDSLSGQRKCNKNGCLGSFLPVTFDWWPVWLKQGSPHFRFCSPMWICITFICPSQSFPLIYQTSFLSQSYYYLQFIQD